MNKVNPIVFLVLVVYPILLIAGGIWYWNGYGLSWLELMLFVTGYYGSNIAVGVGMHRLWAHNSFKTNKVVEFILALFASGTLQSPILVWASDHFLHHTYTDETNDPHSPKKYTNKFLGFFWSHMGWMLFRENVKLNKVTLVKLGKNRILRWQMKHYWRLAAFMNFVLPALLGFMIGGDLHSAITGYLFIGLGRALQQQMTFCVNSLCHFVGTRTYYSGSARDIWWMFMFLLGENWHNYHHAFANDYRNGVKWYQLDIHKWIIFAMEKLGLAWDLVRVSNVRIDFKIKETHNYIVQDIKNRLQSIEEKARFIANIAQEHLDKTEKMAGKLAVDVMRKLDSLRDSALNLSNNVKLYLNSPEMLQERIINEANDRIKKLEGLAKKLGLMPNFAV